MSLPKLPDSDFIEQFEKIGPHALARKVGISVRRIYARRSRLEDKYGRQLTGPDKHNSTRHGVSHPGRIHHEIRDGIVLIGSDAHYWPGIISTAHRAFVHFCGILKPKIVVKNGDVMDFPSISRHTPIGWEDRPTVIDEIEAAQERLAEIHDAAPKANFVWPLGNHDGRFETRLATLAPEYAEVHGVHLKDHFGAYWEPCWSLFLNKDVVVKHRFRGGIHATHNNVMWAGKSIFTGHLHALGVRAFSDYGGTRWGGDTGTLADPYGDQFEYLEDNPRNWRAGFLVLTFFRGRLLWPEIVHVLDESHVDFRGKVIRV